MVTGLEGDTQKCHPKGAMSLEAKKHNIENVTRLSTNQNLAFSLEVWDTEIHISFHRDIDSLQLANIKGFILNVPTDFKWGFFKLPIQRKHWIAVRKVNSSYYNLDSKLDAPEEIGTESELRSYLKEQLICREKELLLVVNQDVTGAMVWKEEVNAPHKMSSGGETDSGVASQSPHDSPLHDTKWKLASPGTGFDQLSCCQRWYFVDTQPHKCKSTKTTKKIFPNSEYYTVQSYNAGIAGLQKWNPREFI